MIYITGDVHGDKNRIIAFLNKYKPQKGDTLIVLGDFGFIFSCDDEERMDLDDMSYYPFDILFVDGNHENFPGIYSYPVEEYKGGKVHRIRRNIRHLMRGEIFNLEGKTFFAFGGAYSIDKYLRQEGYSWWKEELPSNEEYKNAEKNLRKAGMKADYILTHTLPKEIILRMGKNPDIHEAELNGFLDWIMYECEFKKHFAGHWHDDREIGDKHRLMYFDIVSV